MNFLFLIFVLISVGVNDAKPEVVPETHRIQISDRSPKDSSSNPSPHDGHFQTINVAGGRSQLKSDGFASSTPLPPDRKLQRREAVRLVLKTPLFAFLIFLPGFLLCSIAARRGVRSTVNLGLVALAGISIPGYLLFFVYVFSARVGHSLSVVLPIVLAAGLTASMFGIKQNQLRRLTPLLVPFVLVITASFIDLSLGFLYGGMQSPNATASHRFLDNLPPDNSIPWVFAEDLSRGFVPKPMQGDWLSSDRPPLQTGMVLALEPRIAGREVWYLVASVLIQNLWIVAVWLLFRALRVRKRTSALVIATICLSGFAFVNTFYVWPKLLSAAYLVAFAIPVLINLPRVRPVNLPTTALSAFLLISGLLAHGGSFFGLLGLIVVLVFRFRKTRLKEVGVIAMLAILFYAPWTCYQKFVDPPGDRLLKMHLAGMPEVTATPALPAILNAYRQQRVADWWAAKRSNWEFVFEHETEYFQRIIAFARIGNNLDVRVSEFFLLMPALGLLVFGPVCLLFRRYSRAVKNEMAAAERLLFWSSTTAFIWILLMFAPSSTSLHQGSYAMVLMAMAGSILAVRSVAPSLAAVVCVIQCAFQWLLYVLPIQRPGLPSSLSTGILNPWMMGLHILSLAAFIAILTLMSRSSASRDLQSKVA